MRRPPKALSPIARGASRVRRGPRERRWEGDTGKIGRRRRATSGRRTPADAATPVSTNKTRRPGRRSARVRPCSGPTPVPARPHDAVPPTPSGRRIPGREESWEQFALIAGRAVWFYLWKLVWPHPLAFFYPRWPVDAGQFFQYLPPIAVLAVLAGLWRLRARWGKGPWVAAAYFLITLFPALGFFNVYPMRFSFVADHFQYLAAIGPIAMGAAGLGRMAAPPARLCSGLL